MANSEPTQTRGDEVSSRSRQKPPERTPSKNIRVKTPEGYTVYLTLQFDPAAPERPCGIFYASGFKSGAQLEFLMHDACIITSMLIQHGYNASEILAKLSSITTHRPAANTNTLIGVILQELANFENNDK